MQKTLTPQRVLHFNRWSRNAAAAFHSVGNVVNIGRLRANVLEQIAPKSSHALLQTHAGAEAYPLLSEWIEEGYDPWQEELEEILWLSEETTDSIAALPD